MTAFAAFHAIAVIFITIGGADFHEFGFVVSAFGAEVIMDGENVDAIGDFNGFCEVGVFLDLGG